jgi:Cupin domain
MMTKTKSTLSGACLLLLLGGASQAADFDPQRPVALPAENLAFGNINPMVRMADSYGDMTKGMHGTFGKFPAKSDSGTHTHTGAYHGVVIKGVMTNPFNGETNPPQMGPGSYWYVPANAPHATLCISDEACEFYFYADSAFDFLPVER